MPHPRFDRLLAQPLSFKPHRLFWGNASWSLLAKDSTLGADFSICPAGTAPISSACALA
jgi:hypothetical protein